MRSKSYTLSDFERYKGIFGCYAFYQNEVCLYIGKATCVYSRVKGHKLRFENYERFMALNFGKHIENMNYANTHVFLSLMEAYLITVMKPLENAKRPDFIKMLMMAYDKAEPAYRVVESLTKCFQFTITKERPKSH